MRHELEQAAELISSAEALLVCAGAGIGVDSGLPDFRGDTGFWQAYPPYARLGMNFMELANPENFAADPALAWGFYGHRLNMYRRTEPHDGFRLLRDWGERKPGGVHVFTSNVDRQFQRGGFQHVAEAHGSIYHLQCLDLCGRQIWPAEDVVVDVDPETMRAQPALPTCPECGGLARPNILMFGDGDWIPDRTDRQLESLREWRRGRENVVVVELGAGTAVPTVRRQAELASAADGALIRINPREPEIRHGRGVSLPLGALEALQALEPLVRP